VTPSPLPPPVHIVILAAGKGTRMKSRIPKVLHRVGGAALIDHLLRAAAGLQPETQTLVIGHQTEDLKAHFEGREVAFAIQEPQLGTGHALLQAESALTGRTGCVLLLSGDVPLIRAETLTALVDHHLARGAAATVLTAIFDSPDGYGRIVRKDGAITAIVEHKDASAEERKIREINSGIYVFDLPPLFDALRQVGSSNAQGEYYLPDLVRVFRQMGRPVEAVVLADSVEILGVNSRKELADVAAVLRDRKNAELMASGVTIIDPASTWIQPDVTVGADTVIHPNVYLEGATRVGAGCELNAGVRVVDSVIGDGVVISNYCVIRQSVVDRGARIGPFAQLRPDSHVGESAHVGNFVELKKTTMGKGAKANHLAYLGDATIGEKVNIGAGTITCNYDGVNKHQTIIEDGAFIGSDSQLIAPVRVGRGAYVAAGSSITQDVPEGTLAIARSRQVNKPGWIARLKQRKD